MLLGDRIAPAPVIGDANALLAAAEAEVCVAAVALVVVEWNRPVAAIVEFEDDKKTGVDAATEVVAATSVVLLRLAEDIVAVATTSERVRVIVATDVMVVASLVVPVLCAWARERREMSVVVSVVKRILMDDR